MVRAFFFGIIAFSLLNHLVFGQSYDCNDAYECTSTEISVTAGETSSIRCSGYHSCAQAVKIESMGNTQILCLGGYACAHASLIQHDNSTYHRHIYCSGTFSCAFVDLIYNKHGYVYCGGELSCSESVALAERVTCSGDRSCYKSFLQVQSSSIYSPSIWLFGHLSAQDATINVDSDDSGVYAYGYNAANGAELICNGTCDLSCYAGGCNNITLSCISDDSSCTFIIDCHSAEYSQACPNGYIIPDYLSIPSLRDKEFSTYDNLDKACNSSITGAVHCDDYQECYASGTISATAPVCCTAYYSCTFTSNIYPNIESIDTNSSTTAFRADAYWSANDMTGSLIAQNGGNLYFAAKYANWRGTSSYITTIETLSDWDIIVTGYSGLSYKIIQQARNLYCGGYYACRGAIISSFANMVYGGGYYSLSGASLHNIGGSVYCAGKGNCEESSMNNIGGNVVGIGEDCMYDSNFSNINGTVAGFGYQSLYSADMNNVVNVWYINFV